MRSFLLVVPVLLVPFPVVVACGGARKPVEGESRAVVTPGTLAPSAPPPPCSDAPMKPGEVIAKEPTVFNTCLASAGAAPQALCGNAKIAVEVGKDGRISRAEVTQSSLPPAV